MAAEAFTVVSLIGSCAKVIAELHDLRGRYTTIGQTLDSIVTECSTLESALAQVKALGKSKRRARFEKGTELQMSFETALKGCSVTLEAVQLELEKLNPSSSQDGTWTGNMKMSTKVRFMWNEKTMQAFLEQLRGQRGALQLLLQAHAQDSLNTMHDLLARNQSVLNKIHADAMVLRARTISSRRQRPQRQSTLLPIAETENCYTESIFEQPMGEESSLDNDIFNSRVYQRVHASPQPPPAQPVPPPNVQNPDPHLNSLALNLPLPTPGPSPAPSISRPLDTSPTNSLISDQDLAQIAGASRISREEALINLRRLEELGGPEEFAIACRTVLSNGHDVVAVLTQLHKLKTYGTTSDYKIVLEILVALGHNLGHTVDCITKLHVICAEADYPYALELFKAQKYDIVATESGLQALKAIGSTKMDFSRSLQYLSKQKYALDVTKKDLEALKELGTGERDFTRILAVLEFHQFDLSTTLSQLGQLKGSKSQLVIRLPGLPAPTTEDMTLQFSVSLQLLEVNNFQLQQTVTEIQYLCDVAESVASQKYVLRALRFSLCDFNMTVRALQWLRLMFRETFLVHAVLEANNFNFFEMAAAFDAMTSLVPDNCYFLILAAVVGNEFSFSIAAEQIKWCYKFLPLESEFDFVLRIFMAKGWNRDRMWQLLGSTIRERTTAIALLQAHVKPLKEEVNELLEEMGKAVGPTATPTDWVIADKFLKERSYDLKTTIAQLLRLKASVVSTQAFSVVLQVLVKNNYDVDRTAPACKRYSELFGRAPWKDAKFYEFAFTIVEKLDFDIDSVFRGCQNIRQILSVVDRDPDSKSRLNKAFRAALYTLKGRKYDFNVIISDLEKLKADHGNDADFFHFTIQAAKALDGDFERATTGMEALFQKGLPPRVAYERWASLEWNLNRALNE
ncbi:hypothetical protein FRC14_003070 [Serendipita sp. 396]|nr:hypothetical protein FRC14_003070 [Serendipita sp. 396]KAG8784315.1 hypothetical protein FRC15_003474 [Serendipita sp. 397]